MRKCKCNFISIVGKSGVASEIEVAKQDKFVKFMRFGTIKGIRFLYPWCRNFRRIMETEFLSH